MARPGSFLFAIARGKKGSNFQSVSHHLFIIIIDHRQLDHRQQDQDDDDNLSPCRATVASHSVTLSS